MSTLRESLASRTIFGIPAVLTRGEVATLIRDLTQLWLLTYGQVPAQLEADIEMCRQFFDPVARGQTLRDRLARLEKAPVALRRAGYPDPLVVDVGDNTMIVGVEARVLLALLEDVDTLENHIVLSPTSVANCESLALGAYRRWARARLNQVVALRSGKGAEVLQAVAVGIVIALLVNRSDSPDRAMLKRSHDTQEGKQIDGAIYSSAEEFADVVSSGRSGRSTSERRLKGGYALTEARRRLAHRLIFTTTADGNHLVYIDHRHRRDVIQFLGSDLARRVSLSSDTLSIAFDRLVAEFRTTASNLAHRSVVFERSGDTRELKEALMVAFDNARNKQNRDNAAQ
jgi:hypothetical protein